MDYKNGKIYTIRSHQTDDIYYGSTTQPLYKRLGYHKRGYRAYMKKETCGYFTSFEIIKFDDCYIELVEEFPCDNKEQLTKREGEFIRSNKCVNKVIPGRTQKEYRKDNKELITEKKKIYREINKEKIAEHKSVKCECECSISYTYCHKSRHFKSKKHQTYEQNK